jgi:D-alanyl-D-alanine carboxypeptidase (penicillin-binding protein 5/6)
MVLQPRVYKGDSQSVSVGPQTAVAVTVPRGGAAGLRVSTSLEEPLLAPLRPGQRVGELRVQDGNTVISRVPLVVGEGVAAGGTWARTRDTIALWFR